MRPVITDAELKEALEVAGKATPDENGKCRECELDFKGYHACWCEFRHGHTRKFDAKFNPEFASRLIKEVIWARGMLNVAHEIITNRDLPDDTWLSDYERGPE